MLRFQIAVPTLSDAKQVVQAFRVQRKAKKLAKQRAFEALIAEEVLKQLKADERLNPESTEGEAS